MRRRRWSLLVGLGALLLALVLLGVWPQSADGYRSTVESGVQDAVSSVGTARNAGRLALEGGTFRTYDSTVLDDARTSVSNAFSDISRLSTPDSGSRRTRDGVLPLLQESVRLIDDLDLGIGEDDRDLTARSVDGLGSVGERLAAVLEGVR